MILNCPDCSARYLIPATVFATGPRRVRCVRCNHVWLADTDGSVDVVPTDIQGAPTTEKETSASSLPSSYPELPPSPPADPSKLPVVWSNPLWKKIKRLIKLILWAFLTLFVLWGIIFRQSIAERSPVMEVFYETLGFEIYRIGEGLRFLQVRSEKRYEDGETRLIVEGQIYNESGIDQPIPTLRITALGPDGKELQGWTMKPSLSILRPHLALSFETSKKAVEGSVTEVNLSFVGEAVHEQPHHE